MSWIERLSTFRRVRWTFLAWAAVAGAACGPRRSARFGYVWLGRRCSRAAMGAELQRVIYFFAAVRADHSAIRLFFYFKETLKKA